MPRKIRELIRDLELAGFVNRGGKGSHRNFVHASDVVLTISGNLGDDVKPYQEKLARQKIKEAQDERER
jgi:predicted RNA binding protein YcfA (HicA-like mRNA interferase family)